MVKSFTIETSARHVHLNDEAVKILFGEDYNYLLKAQAEERSFAAGPAGSGFI